MNKLYYILNIVIMYEVFCSISVEILVSFLFEI